MIGIDTNILVFLELREMPLHTQAHELLRREVLTTGEAVALAPQILAEFVHVATDPRRFQQPLSMSDALRRAADWWNAKEVQHVYPSAESTQVFLDWMTRHSLGRKRLLDTQLAATLHSAGVNRLMTGNAGEFAIYAAFEILSP